MSKDVIDSDRAMREAYDQLRALADASPRFHGSDAHAQVERLIVSWLEDAGVSVQRQEVVLPGWSPGIDSEVRVNAPIDRVLPSWPMIWSGGADDVVSGTLEYVGVEGFWGDSMTWRKYAVVNKGQVVAYLHARDGGPGAPQPLPIGSDRSLPHLAVGHIDGLMLHEWITDSIEIGIEVRCNAHPTNEVKGNNLIVDVSPAESESIALGPVVIAAHYDSLYNTPGAYDNGSGAVALARLASELVKNPPARPVTLLFPTAEEWHLGGSRVFVDSLDQNQIDSYDFMLNVDGLGRGSFMEAFAGPETFEREFTESIRAYADNNRPDLTMQSRFPPTCGVDLAPFYAAGVPVGYFTFNDLHLLHQPNDVPTLESAQNIVWAVPLIQHLASTLPRGDRFSSSRLAIPF